ncbi:putative T7SS-secreted protein [Streptomyces sp. cg35]|uniref:putative T7SS-secreted protein n=1 Tax=Streptomyces sp. cg35 TaxID=3421650 RepID=UPI003D16DC33
MSWRSIFIADDDGWPGLGFNPARGDVPAIADIAADVRAVGRELDDLHALVSKTGRSASYWTGEGADAFRKKVGKLPTYLEQGTESMTACGKALLSWHDTLESLQKQGDPLEADAVAARREWERLSRNAEAASDRAAYGGLSGDAQKTASQRMRTALTEADAAKEKLDALIRRGEEIHKRWSEAAARAAHAVKEATALAPESLGLWDKITGALKDVWGDFTDWLVENADLLSTISSGLAAAALVLQVVPVIGNAAGAVLGIASAACAAGAAVGHYIGYRRGNGSTLLDVGGDLLGVLPLGKAGTSLVKSGAKVVKAARAGTRAVDEAGEVITAGKALRSAGQALDQGYVDTATQKVLTNTVGKVAEAFGRPMTDAALQGFSRYSQAAMNGVSSGLGAWDLASENRQQNTETVAPGSGQAKGAPFHAALAA